MESLVKEAPIFTCTYDLHCWLLDRFDGDKVESHRNTRQTVLHHSRRLLESVTLAFENFDTERQLVEADQSATLLRVFLRLAAQRGLLDDRQLLFANKLLRDIGRQLGGWRKHRKSIR